MCVGSLPAIHYPSFPSHFPLPSPPSSHYLPLPLPTTSPSLFHYLPLSLPTTSPSLFPLPSPPSSHYLPLPLPTTFLSLFPSSQGSSFIRCLKPNLRMESSQFVGGQILSQLQSAGVWWVVCVVQWVVCSAGGWCV